MRTINVYYSICLYLFLINFHLYSIDNFHFYRGHFWNDEVRYSKDHLKSFDVLFGSARAHESFNGFGQKVPLFGVHGVENLRGLGIQSQDINNQPLRTVFNGHFDLFEAQLQSYINFCNGFYMHTHLPIRSMHICDAEPIACDRVSNRGWIAAINELDNLLQNKKLSLAHIKKSGAGDFSALVGWSWTTYDTCAVDYIDADIELGVLFPTSKKQNIHKPFDIPLGYDGHWAIPLIFDIATGYCDWLTIGAHLTTLFFIDKNQCVRPRTNCAQTGFIRVSDIQNARVEMGNIWSLSLYLKADHFAHGFSATVGYSHDQQGDSNIWLCNQMIKPSIVNSDPRLAGWHMNILHFLLEYDWSHQDNPNAPHIGFEYNYIINGKNIFNASSAAGYFGVHVECNY